MEIKNEKVHNSYGVLCTGFTAAVREWLPKYSFDVADWMIQNNITPIYLGKKQNDFGFETKSAHAQLNDSAIHPGGIDLRDQTDLLQATKIMAGAKFVAGVDNGLLHLASLTDAPTIWGFTSILPHTRLPFRHGTQDFRTLYIVPEPTLQCRFCQTRQNYIPSKKRVLAKMGIGHDYKECYYEDYECLKHLTAGKFIDKIKQIIGYKGHGARMGSK